MPCPVSVNLDQTHKVGLQGTLALLDQLMMVSPACGFGWVCLLLSVANTVSALNLFGQNWIGDGTFYQTDAKQTNGACAFGVSGAADLPWTAGLTGPKFVALDAPLYTQGAVCGQCIALYGDPKDANCKTCGTTPIPQTVQYVMVSNEVRER